MKRSSFSSATLLFICCVTTAVFSASSLSAQLADVKGLITAVAETEKYFWIGTEDGLWKINKKNSQREHLTMDNSQLPSNDITCICVEPDGNVWIGTPAGILRYDNYVFYALDSKNANLPDDHITAIACDINDNIWIG